MPDQNIMRPPKINPDLRIIWEILRRLAFIEIPASASSHDHHRHAGRRDSDAVQDDFAARVGERQRPRRREAEVEGSGISPLSTFPTLSPENVSLGRSAVSAIATLFKTSRPVAPSVLIVRAPEPAEIVIVLSVVSPAPA